MQAEADARRGRGEIDWSPLFDKIGTPTRVVVAIAITAWIAWKVWR